jgi:hypothetical protein
MLLQLEAGAVKVSAEGDTYHPIIGRTEGRLSSKRTNPFAYLPKRSGKVGTKAK